MKARTVYKLLYILIIVVLIFSSAIEVHLILFSIPLFLSFFERKMFFSKNVFNIISALLLIVIFGVFASFLNSFSSYDWVKDLVYFLKPIIAIISGYYLTLKIDNFKFLLKVLVMMSFLAALIHIFKIIFNIDFSSSSVSEIRRVGGISNMFIVVSIILIIISFKNLKLKIFENKLVRNLVFLMLCISFILYFSRTMFVSAIIFLLAVFGYIKLTSKGLKYIAITLVVIGIFYAYLFSIKIERDKPGIDSFLYKLKIAPSEIFIPSKNIDEKNHEDLWDHWRAYEASRALNEMNQKPMSYVYGKGFGALVDLKFKAPLGKENIRYIPILHNGYIYILFKTGIIGLVVYLLLLLMLYLNSYKKYVSKEVSLISNSIAGISLYYLFTTLIITGVYNGADIFTFILGILFFLQHNLNKMEENKSIN